MPLLAAVVVQAAALEWELRSLRSAFGAWRDREGGELVSSCRLLVDKKYINPGSPIYGLIKEYSFKYIGIQNMISAIFLS